MSINLYKIYLIVVSAGCSQRGLVNATINGANIVYYIEICYSTVCSLLFHVGAN